MADGLHIVYRDADPTEAPPRAGIHWVNTVTKKTFFSIGTDTVLDWKAEVTTALQVESTVTDLVVGTNSVAATLLTAIYDVTFFDSLMNEIEFAYQIVGGNTVEISSNLNINNVTVRIEGE